MANDKKDTKDKKLAPAQWDTLEVFLFLLFILMILGALIPRIIGNLREGFFSSASRPEYVNALRIPPLTAEDEDTLLGAIMTGRAQFADVAEEISADSFRDAKNRAIFNAIRDLFVTGRDVTFVNLANLLKGRGILDDVGGITHLRDQMERAREFRVAGENSFVTRADRWIRMILSWIAVISIAVITYASITFSRIYKKRIETFLTIDTSPEDSSKKRWRRILDLSNSNNSSDWKIAIIEADMILEEIVERMGFGGETLGDRLKNIEKSDFVTLDDAWKAHKYRNSIVHGGIEPKRADVKETLALYEKVFSEFEYL